MSPHHRSDRSLRLRRTILHLNIHRSLHFECGRRIRLFCFPGL